MQLKFSNIIDFLEQYIPEYKDSSYYRSADKTNYSSFYGGFANFLLDRIINYPETDPVIKKSFSLLNKMIVSSDRDVASVAQVEVFEAIARSKKSMKIAKKLLNDTGLFWLKKTKERMKSGRRIQLDSIQ